MKNKLLTTLLTIFALCTCLFTLSACDVSLNENKPHEHSFTNYVSDNNATDIADGTKTATCDGEDCDATDTITDVGSKLISGQGLKYTLNSDKQSYSVEGLGTCTDTNIIIPSTYENKPVTSIGKDAFTWCNNITSIEISNSVTSIGNSAFNGCYNLTSVTIGNSVTSIGEDAFAWCNNITSIEIPNSVTSIGSRAFYECRKVTSIEIPNGVTSIGNSAFNGCESLTSVTIGNSLISISGRAFAYCYNLTSVILGKSVTSIGEDAFYACFKLVEVVNKSSHITVTKGAKDNGKVGYYALAVYNSGDTFAGTKLSSDNGYIVYTDGNEKSLVDYNGTETSLIIPNYVTKINNYAFDNCDTLTRIVISNNVTSIGDCAFYDCDNLTSVTIGNSVTSIGGYAFFLCSSLASITIPSSVTSIGYVAFSGCSDLINVTFNDTTAWYIVDDFTDWQNKTGGMQFEVTNPSTNATFVKSKYYWYKK